jgi:hypothetical protein
MSKKSVGTSIISAPHLGLRRLRIVPPHAQRRTPAARGDPDSNAIGPRSHGLTGKSAEKSSRMPAGSGPKSSRDFISSFILQTYPGR